MTRFFLRIYDVLSRRKRTAWSITAVLTLLFVALAWQQDYSEDISAFLPRDGESAKYASVYAKLGGEEKVMVTLRSASPERPTSVSTLQEAMSDFGAILTAADTAGCVKNLQVCFDEESVAGMLQCVWQNYPRLLQAADYARIDSALAEPAFLREQMEGNRQMLMLPTGGMMVENVRHDPLHFSTERTKGLAGMNANRNFRLIDGYLFSADATRGYILFDSPYGISESGRNAQLADLLDEAIDRYHREHPDSEVQVSAVGAPLIAVTNARQIKHDSILALSLASLLILLILAVAFRKPSHIFWIGFSILFGWLFALGCLALLRDGLSLIVIGVSSVIIGIAVNYPLHFIDHLKHSSDKREVLKDMVQPLLIGNVTTVSAFLCLVLLDAEAMRDLGLMGALLLAGTILFVLVLLPVVVAPLKATAENRKSRLCKWITKCFVEKIKCFVIQTNKHLEKTKCLVVLALSCLFFYFSLGTSFDADMMHINYMTESQRTDLAELQAGMADTTGTRTLYVVAEGRTLEEALRCNEDLEPGLAATPGVKHVRGIGPYVPSQRRQQANLDAWRQFREAHPTLAADFRTACADAGFSENAFTPFTAWWTDTATAKSPDEMAEAMQVVAHHFILTEPDRVQVISFVDIDTARYAAAKSSIRAALPAGAFAFDGSDVSSHLVTTLSDSFDYVGFVCAFVVFAFLWLSFGRFELSIVSFLPLAVGWVWILGGMNLLGLQFNIVNIILATFIFGQGDDYTIFITEGLMHEYAYGRRVVQAYKRSVVLSALIMLVGIGVLVFAKHPALRSLGQVTIIGMAVVVYMAFRLPPVVFGWLTTVHGQVREYPLTLGRIARSFYALCAFFLALGLSFPLIFAYAACVRNQSKRSLFIHKILERFSRFAIHRVPKAPLRVVNSVGEDFRRPALIICNHQSQLDLIAVMALHTRITILTKEWVWRNPYYGKIIRMSEFYPVTNGVQCYEEGLRDLVRRGYSIVVFPEGTRSAEGILRFHQGAFLLARQLELDILPLYLHGFNDVLPRHDFMLREGRMTLEVGERMPAAEVMQHSALELRRHFHRLYVARFDEMCRRYADSAYYLPFVRYKYMYKGAGIERRAARLLKKRDYISSIVDRDFAGVESYVVDDPGQGEIPYIMAKVHPGLQVYAEFSDEDDFLVASHLQGLPENLHLSLKEAHP